jgi:hypothetical protein
MLIKLTANSGKIEILRTDCMVTTKIANGECLNRDLGRFSRVGRLNCHLF